MATSWVPAFDLTGDIRQVTVAVGIDAALLGKVMAARVFQPVATTAMTTWLLSHAGYQAPPWPEVVVPPTTGQGWPR